MAKFTDRHLRDIISDLKAAVENLERAEVGQLPYCDDPEDGCAEVWCEYREEFEKASKELLEYPFAVDKKP